MIIRTLVHGLVAAGLIAGAGMAWADSGQPSLQAASTTTDTGYRATPNQAGYDRPGYDRDGWRTGDNDDDDHRRAGYDRDRKGGRDDD
jgi:hypothetical protein